MSLDLLESYSKMNLIRQTEEMIADEYLKGKMRCPTHLSIGQESVAVGVCNSLSDDDWIFSNHRCHAHYLAKGGNLDAMIAELYGKSTGCAGGIGGSMHLVDESVGMMGTSAIVGSIISVAVGAAMAFKLQKRDSSVTVFFGDSGPETGQLYEAINFSVVHRLPIMFVCEDNGYSTQTPMRMRQPDRVFADVADAMGLYARDCDDGISSVEESAKICLMNLPSLLYVDTYRYREHVGPNYDYELGYRPREEVDYAEDLDPISMLRKTLIDEGLKSELEVLEFYNNQRVVRAFEFAENSPWPKGF